MNVLKVIIIITFAIFENIIIIFHLNVFSKSFIWSVSKLYFMKVLVCANLWRFLVGQFFCMELCRCLFDSLGYDLKFFYKRGYC